jgi:SAM-dependent methyltransferase
LTPLEVWEVAERYEQYVGRWSRPVAAAFVDWLEVPAGVRWLDVGCGTGALSASILARSDPAAVVGVDSSQPFVAHASASTDDARASFLVADAGAIPVPDGAFGAAVSGLFLNFVPNPGAVLSELGRVVTAGGIVAAYVWDYADGMEVIRRFWQAAADVDPAAVELDEGRRFPLARAGALERSFLLAGLEAVEVRAIDPRARFRDFQDYWTPFLGGQGPAPAYAVSLDDDRRAAVRERLQQSLPFRGDGSLELPIRAWAVRGRRPA